MIARQSIPNLITTLRVLALPVLWLLALRGADVALGVGLALASLTDALDGYLARRWRAQSALGSRFDSIADALLFVSAGIWLVLLRPEFLRQHAAVLAVWVLIGAAAYLVGWVRFRRIADLHLYSAKAASLLGFAFVAYLLVFRDYPLVAFYVVIAVCLVAATETLLAMLLLDDVDESLTSLLTARRRGDRGARGAGRGA